MSTDADRFREDAIADEWEEWAAEQVARLWEVHADDVPWNDAAAGDNGKVQQREEEAGAMTLVGEIERLGRAASRGEMTEQEATAELLKVARLTPASAAAMIKDWRGAVDGYEEFGCLMVKWTAEGARRATEANAAR